MHPPDQPTQQILDSSGRKSKPSWGFIAALGLAGLFIGNIFISALTIAAAFFIEKKFPSKPICGAGLMRNRTKAVLNLIACFALVQMIRLYPAIWETDLFATTTGWGNSSNLRGMMNLLGLCLAAWLGYQSFLAKKTNQPAWFWIFGSLAVAYLPFLHFFLGMLWMAVDIAVIILLLVSTIKFKLPTAYPVVDRGVSSTRNAPSLEEELRSLKKLQDDTLITQEEFEEQKRSILEKSKK
jgi:hypothetical protein